MANKDYHNVNIFGVGQRLRRCTSDQKIAGSNAEMSLPNNTWHTDTDHTHDAHV